MSGTGIIVGILFLLVNLVGKKYIRTFLIGIPALPFILIPIMAIFANRGENYVQESFGTRVEIFFENIGKGQIISDQFGIGTNVAVIFQENFGWNSGAFIADSTYASIVANTGIIGIVIFMLLIFYWFVHVYVVNSIELYSFTLIFVLFGATTILPESYPGNLLFALLLAYYFDKNKLFKTHK